MSDAQLFEVFGEFTAKIRTPEDLRLFLDSQPDPTFTEEKLALAALKFLPQLIKFGSKKLASEIGPDAPLLPRGRPSVDIERKSEIVAYLGKLHTQGCSLELSKRRTAQRFALSESTIQRVWDDRGNMSEADFRSVMHWLSEP